MQALNRDGVKALQHHRYDQAKKLFYKAYLLDPNDPFTLNNLGYISELEGEIDRAQRYYALAGDLSSDAIIDKATSESVEGKSVAEVAGNAEDKQLEINRLNIEAMSLMMHDRTPEAEVVLGKALQLDIHNPFTLNNIGYCREQEGELESALSYYSAAAARNSDEKIVVAVNPDWRGKSISEIADRNSKKVRKAIEDQSSDASAVVARLNLRGVAAMNRNDRRAARDYFQQAYKLEPNDAFTLNNMGYVAEMDGDRETAEFYYAKAKEADEANKKVAVSTRADLAGQPLRDVATYGDNKVEAKMAALVEARRREGGPVALKRRDGSVIVEPPMPPKRAPQIEMPANDQPQGGVLPPLPDNQQPPAAQPGAQPQTQPLQGQPVQDVIPPLPDNQQPPEAKPNTQPPAQGQPAQDVIPPLPDNQQPPAAKPNTQPPAQGQQPLEGQKVMDVIPPLPDDQQPPEVKNQQKPPAQKPPR